MWVFLYITTIYRETYIMKFIDLFDDMITEGKNFNDEKFDKFKDNAGWWLFDLYQNTPSDITKMPGFPEYRNFVLNNSKYSKEELKTFDDLVYTLPDYYGLWLNLLPFGSSNKMMSRTITMYDLQDKMVGRDSSAPRKRGRKPKVQNVEPSVSDDDDAMAHLDQAVEKRRRGRPSIPDELKKRYIPTGLPRGRRPKVRDAEAEPEMTMEPMGEPVVKQRGGARPGAGRPNMSKYEPTMVPTKIKTLEDRIASLEALLREKGILEEQRLLLKSRLRMMKDYRKFL
jgi:hypothetical protein